jgi:hypothetical protein
MPHLAFALSRTIICIWVLTTQPIFYLNCLIIIVWFRNVWTWEYSTAVDKAMFYFLLRFARTNKLSRSLFCDVAPRHWIIGAQRFEIPRLSRNIGRQLPSNAAPRLRTMSTSTNRCKSPKTDTVECRSAMDAIGIRVIPWISDFPSFTGMFEVCERCTISDFRRYVDEICALLGYYESLSGRSVLTFREHIGPIFKGQEVLLDKIFRRAETLSLCVTINLTKTIST